MAFIRALLLIWKLPPIRRFLVLLPLLIVFFLWVIAGARACNWTWLIIKLAGKLLTEKKPAK